MDDDKDLIIAKYKRRSRMMSVLAAVLMFLTFISFIYAFVQQGIAEENRRLAEQKSIEATQNAIEANRQKEAAMKAQVEAEKQNALCKQAQEALKK